MEESIALIGRFVIALVALLLGAMFVRWGVHLYRDGVIAKVGSLKTIWKDSEFVLTNGAPGTFLSVGGIIVMAIALLTMPGYDGKNQRVAERRPTGPSAVQHYVVGRPGPALPAASPQPVASVEQAAESAPAGPTSDQDRAAALMAVARYAQALESRRIDRVRAAYPGISDAETVRWTEFFSHFDGGENLSVSYDVLQEPVIEDDVATITFTLTLRYQSQRHQVTSRATLRRAGSGWALQELRSLR